MIQGIRRKFILIAVAVLSAAMITLAVVINVSNWIQVRGEIKETLTDLAENTGNNGKVEKGGGRKGRNRHMQNTLDESRFFTVHIFSNDVFLVLQVEQSPILLVATDYYATAFSAVAAIGTRFRTVFFALQMCATRTAAARFDVYFNVVYKIIHIFPFFTKLCLCVFQKISVREFFFCVFKRYGV